jgi:hypothetical protein
MEVLHPADELLHWDKTRAVDPWRQSLLQRLPDLIDMPQRSGQNPACMAL